MAMTTLTLAWVLLVASPAQTDEVVAINKRQFKIPILIDPERRPLIKQLVLYVSTDKGETWRQEVVRSPDQDHFPFHAQADGLYWFKVAVIDQQDQQQPPDIYRVPPHQKILVDTLSPDVRLTTVERQGEELLVGWEISEDHPDWASLRLDYRLSTTASAADWQPIPITPQLHGQTRTKLPSTAALTLRLELRDQAGNAGSVVKEIPAAAAPVERLPTLPPPVQAHSPVLPPASGSSPLLPGVPPAPAPVPLADQRLPTPSPMPLPDHRPAPPAPWPAAGNAQPLPNNLPGYDPAVRVIASTSSTDVMPALGGVPATTTSRSPQLNTYIVNDPQISLEYEVMRFGSSGIGKVELWLTEDDGRTWRAYAEDPDLKSPLTARLPGQGIFGLRLVITSGAGLSEGPPQPGDPPDMRIEVDLTPPAVQLYEPRPDPQRPDTLIISWNATDRNLAAKPVTVEYADKPEGPWLPIVTEQPATGSHPWQPPRQTARVYLRVTAIDTAGNRSVAETPESLLVDLNKPRARIVGIRRP